jgi:hypothetical protein
MANALTRDQFLQAARVEDYVSDKIQTIADLQNLDLLLASLKNQQELQRKQVHIPSVLISISIIIALTEDCFS